jgi:hypothetical protein
MTAATDQGAAAETSASLKASAVLVRVSDPKAFPTRHLAAMPHTFDQDPGMLTALLAKFLPAAFGAALMIMVDMPKTKREYFARFAAAFIVSGLFGGALFDLLDSFSLFSFLDEGKRSHVTAIDGLAGACGYFVVGGAAQFLQRFKANPTQAVQDARDAL